MGRLSPEWRWGLSIIRIGIVESENLPSVASGFPRPSGNCGASRRGELGAAAAD